MNQEKLEAKFAPLVAHPFQRPGLAWRALPFAVVAVLALGSLALPPGPASKADAFAAWALFLATGAALLLPWHRLPRSLTVLVPALYSASVLMLVLAAGGTTSGVGIVILIPLVWTALYHRRRESAVIVAAIVAVEVVTCLMPVVEPWAVVLRRVIFWAALGWLISVATHQLRQRAVAMIEVRDEMHRQTVALERAAEELTTLRSSHDVLAVATRVAAAIASPPGTPGRRSHYCRVSGDMVKLVAQFDETGQFVSRSFPLAEHPHLSEVVRTGHAVHRPLSATSAGPAVAKLIEWLGATDGVYVPVFHEGEIDGVLVVTARSADIPDELFEQCKAVGHLTELALSNALAHEELLELASTDALTGTSNRRGFDQLIENRPGPVPFTILVIDLDGLKRVNDSKGHAAGDALLAHVAITLQGSLRRGDSLARLGGDEFAAVLFDADEADGRRVAERMLQALAASPLDGEAPSASIGIAAGSPEDSASAVFEAADAAMYGAKRLGGSRYAVHTAG